MKNKDVWQRVHTTLLEARSILSDKDHWTTREWRGRRRRRNSYEIVDTYCAIGAVRAVAQEQKKLSDMTCNVLFKAAGDMFAGISPMTVNDDHGHEAVMMMYDRAIILAEKKLAEVSGEE